MSYANAGSIRRSGRKRARSLSPPPLPANTGIGAASYPRIEPRDAECAAKLKRRTLTNLYNERPAWLVHAHEKLDAAVATAYGWPADLGDDEMLSRMLALNHERAAAELAEGSAKPKTFRISRAKHADELI